MENRLLLLKKGLAFVESDEIDDALELSSVILQRQLKAIGSYAYLTHEKKRGNYLGYISPAIESLVYPDLVKSARWSFLSEELPQLMEKLWNKAKKEDLG